MPDEVDDIAEPGSGWADAVAKILNTGKRSNKGHILAKAALHEEAEEQEPSVSHVVATNYLSKRLKPHPQQDALLENELKDIATRGVVHLFNVVKTVNPKTDKKKKKKKKKKRKNGKR